MRDEQGTGHDDPDLEDKIDAAHEHGDAFLALVGQYFRGEMDRVTMWRARLDRTTNWSVILVASLLTWAFSSDQPHFILLVAVAILTVFFDIESRRYRFYDAFRARIRMLEKHVFADVFDGNGRSSSVWCRHIGRHLRDPQVDMRWIEALQHRLRHIYAPLFLILLIAWLLRLGVMEGDLQAVIGSAAMGALSGTYVLLIVGLFYLCILTIGVVPWSRRTDRFRAAGEGGDPEDVSDGDQRENEGP